jgi:hypothetical protein
MALCKISLGLVEVNAVRASDDEDNWENTSKYEKHHRL